LAAQRKELMEKRKARQGKGQCPLSGENRGQRGPRKKKQMAAATDRDGPVTFASKRDDRIVKKSLKQRGRKRPSVSIKEEPGLKPDGSVAGVLFNGAVPGARTRGGQIRFGCYKNYSLKHDGG